MGILENWFGRKNSETIDDKEKLGHNTDEQSSEQERIEAFENAVNEGINRRKTQMEEAMRRKHKRGTLASAAILGITLLAAPAEAKRLRFDLAQFDVNDALDTAHDFYKTHKDAEAEEHEDEMRYKRDQEREQTRRQQSRDRRDATLGRERQRTEQTEIKTKGKVASDEVKAAQKSGNYMPPRGGSIEVEETPTGSRTTVRPDSRRGYYPAQGEYEHDEANRGARDAEADFRETGRKSTFLSGRSKAYQESYNRTWDSLSR